MEGENGLLEVKPSCPGSLRTARIPVKNVQGNIKVFLFGRQEGREKKVSRKHFHAGMSSYMCKSVQ